MIIPCSTAGKTTIIWQLYSSHRLMYNVCIWQVDNHIQCRARWGGFCYIISTRKFKLQHLTCLLVYLLFPSNHGQKRGTDAGNHRLARFNRETPSQSGNIRVRSRVTGFLLLDPCDGISFSLKRVGGKSLFHLTTVYCKPSHHFPNSQLSSAWLCSKLIIKNLGDKKKTLTKSKEASVTGKIPYMTNWEAQKIRLRSCCFLLHSVRARVSGKEAAVFHSGWKAQLEMP